MYGDDGVMMAKEAATTTVTDNLPKPSVKRSNAEMNIFSYVQYIQTNA